MMLVSKVSDKFWFPCLGCWPKIEVPTFSIETSPNIYSGSKMMWFCKECATKIIEQLHATLTEEEVPAIPTPSLEELTREELITKLKDNEYAFLKIIEEFKALEHKYKGVIHAMKPEQPRRTIQEGKGILLEFASSGIVTRTECPFRKSMGVMEGGNVGSNGCHTCKRHMGYDLDKGLVKCKGESEAGK